MYRSKEITKKYRKISLNQYKRIDTIFMNSENNKTADLYRLRYNLANKIWKEAINAISHHSIYYTWRNTKLYKKVNLKYQPQYKMANLNYLMKSYSVSGTQ